MVVCIHTCGIYVGDPQACSISQYNTRVIMGSHVFLITQTQIRGREQSVLSVSPLASLMWPATGYPSVQFPPPPLPLPTFPYILLLPSFTLFHSPLKYTNTWIIVSETISTWPTYHAESCHCWILVNVLSALITVWALLCYNRGQECVVCCCFSNLICWWPPQENSLLIFHPQGRSEVRVRQNGVWGITLTYSRKIRQFY